MLPLHARNPPPRKSFHTREKCLIALVLLTLFLLCFGGFFLLPDNFNSERVIKVYKQFQKAGPEIFIPAPPIAPHGLNSHEEDPHIVGDREKLQAKIKEELGDIFDRPETVKRPDSEQQPPIVGPPIKSTESQAAEPMQFHPNGQDPDPDVQEKREKVKEIHQKYCNICNILQIFLKYDKIIRHRPREK